MACQYVGIDLHRRRSVMIEQKPVLTEVFGNVGDPWELYGSRLPLGRIARPDDIARVALVAASNLTSFMTGSTLYVDAGV